MIRRALLLASTVVISLTFAAIETQAATFWTDWSTAIVGTPGSASGTLNGVFVSYSGEVMGGTAIDGTSGIWLPTTSFTGGTVTTSPGVVNDDIRLEGASTGTNTITFASPVQNPLFAIWSLGRSTTEASFNFDATPTLQAGGPNMGFIGVPITVLGNVVSGLEGNGVVQFSGTFNSISWTDTPEFFYAFTVGANGPLAPPTAVPEPASLILLGSGLAGLAWRLRKHR